MTGPATPGRELVLASGSAARAAMLRACGVPLRAQPARVDEAAVKAAMLAEDAPARDIADTLAELKAQRVAQKHPDGLVLGADQVLVQGGTLYDKPADLDAARAQLQALRGKAHELLSAAVVYEAGRPVWRHIGRAQLVMREFSDAFLDAYLDRHGDDLLATVGCYKLEAGGACLFSRVQGDYFSVLGLPLLEVLQFLRTRGVMQE
ncbi:septum formation protein Maf [Rhodobacteraceae bacterium 2CG4]|uniref:Nucleoside triphosphate pyrophosphatase n=1 Tax=Halovulum marinum TaxID=2662447 RepID=A0A6L5Z277_9RHOB|nr:nucleoside triphosphate pyrophosphatase [Halovulum marinum]MSU90676.1 septum formation protein Maf [Halovulum marinum]